MKIEHILKRNYSKKKFQIEKVTSAILQAMLSVNNGTAEDAEKISSKVNLLLLENKKNIKNYVPNVEEVQDLVENELMNSEFKDVAKSYILYRNSQAQKRARNIFEKRITLKPYEYPELYEYVSAIRHSYLIHSEFNFTLRTTSLYP